MPWMKGPPNMPQNSSINYSPQVSNVHIVASSTLMIKFTCQHCLEEHFLNFQGSWWMNTKTNLQLTTRCSRDSSKAVLLELETHTRISMDFVEPSQEE